MDDTRRVHITPPSRIPRGIRMDESLWQFVDEMAGVVEGGNASRLIERWVREKQVAVKKVA